MIWPPLFYQRSVICQESFERQNNANRSTLLQGLESCSCLCPHSLFLPAPSLLATGDISTLQQFILFASPRLPIETQNKNLQANQTSTKNVVSPQLTMKPLNVSLLGVWVNIKSAHRELNIRQYPIQGGRHPPPAHGQQSMFECFSD